MGGSLRAKGKLTTVSKPTRGRELIWISGGWGGGGGEVAEADEEGRWWGILTTLGGVGCLTAPTGLGPPQQPLLLSLIHRAPVTFITSLMHATQLYV
jgi:hypothetical protein